MITTRKTDSVSKHAEMASIKHLRFRRGGGSVAWGFEVLQRIFLSCQQISVSLE